MEQQKGKSPRESAVETRYILMPQHANPQGTAFGGVIIAWIDTVAAMAAQKHARCEVVTAGIDSLVFREPILHLSPRSWAIRVVYANNTMNDPIDFFSIFGCNFNTCFLKYFV